MLPEVALAGLHSQVGLLQGCLLVFTPSCTCRGPDADEWLPIGFKGGGSICRLPAIPLPALRAKLLHLHLQASAFVTQQLASK